MELDHAAQIFIGHPSSNDIYKYINLIERFICKMRVHDKIKFL